MSEILDITNNCLELSIACNAILIGLLAFAYPQIFETKKRLKDISEVFVNKYKSNFAIENYFSILSFLLCISIIFSIFCIFEHERLNCVNVLYYNIILSFIGIAVSAWVYHDLEKLYNKPEKLFSLKKILRSQKKENDDLQLIQTLLARNLVNRYDIYNNKYYLSLLKEIFIKDMEKLTELDKQQKQKELFKWYQDTKYLYRPLEIMQFINQEAVRCDNEEASAEIIKCVLDIFKEMLSKENLSSLYEQETKVSNTFKWMIIYKINHNSLIPEWDMNFITHGYYKTLLDYDKTHIKGMINGNNLNPNENVFQIISYLIKQNDKIDIFVPFLRCLKDMEIPSTNYILDIQRLNCAILAYMLLHKRYSLAYDYMYWQQPLDNSKSMYFYQLIPLSISDIVRCYIKGASIFQENQKFEENEDSRIYKVYVLFILLNALMYRSDNSRNDNILSYNENIIDKNILEDVEEHSLFFNYITGSNFEKDFKKFTQSIEILQQFRIQDTNKLKHFIQNIFEKIAEIIKNKQTDLLNNPICDEDINQFRDEYENGYNMFYEGALKLKQSCDNKRNHLSFISFFKRGNNKKWSKWQSARSLNVHKEKARVIATSYTFQLMLNELVGGLYRELLRKIDKQCTKIDNINDININNDISWGIITNFGNYVPTLKTLISEDNIIYGDNKFYVEGIKIGNKQISFVQSNFRYPQNDREQLVMYIINTANIKLAKNDIGIRFSESTRESNNSDDFFPKEYETDKNVNITVSKPFRISFVENEIIGYKLSKTVKNKQK